MAPRRTVNNDGKVEMPTPVDERASERGGPLRRARSFLREMARMWEAWVVTFACALIIYAIAPQQLGISVYKVTLITGGIILGFWADRWSFGKIRDEDGEEVRRHRMYMRTALVCAGMLAFSNGA